MVIAGSQVTGFVFTSFAQINNNSFQAPDTPREEQEERQEEQRQGDIISLLFNNSVTSMLLSTFIIGIIGALIAKLRTFKKKLDMIELLTKSHIKLKQQAEAREKKFEERFIQSQEEVSKSIGGLCTKLDQKSQELEKKLDEQSEVLETKIDTKTGELEKKIQIVKDESTKALIEFLKENSSGRKH